MSQSEINSARFFNAFQSFWHELDFFCQNLFVFHSACVDDRPNGFHAGSDFRLAQKYEDTKCVVGLKAFHRLEFVPTFANQRGLLDRNLAFRIGCVLVFFFADCARAKGE
jgi:hypothetical protein